MGNQICCSAQNTEAFETPKLFSTSQKYKRNIQTKQQLQAQFFEPKFEIKLSQSPNAKGLNRSRSRYLLGTMAYKKCSNTMEDNQQNLTILNSQMIGSNGKACEGGVAFRVKNELNVKKLSFSQKRKIGFRSKYEFEKKRVLIADDRKIQIIQNDKQSQYPQIKAQYDVGSDDKKIEGKDLKIQNQNQILI